MMVKSICLALMSFSSGDTASPKDSNVQGQRPNNEKCMFCQGNSP